MRPEALIAELADRLRPVQPLKPPGRRAMVWAASALLLVGGSVVLLGPRRDVLIRLTQWDFLWTLAAAGLVGALAAVSALTLAIPGDQRPAGLRVSVWSLLAVWGLLLAALAVRDGFGISSDTHWRGCFVQVGTVGFAPAMILGLMVRRAAALRPRLAGFLTGVAAMAVATIAVQIACPVDNPAHGLAGHYAPVIVLGIAGGLLGQRFLTSATPVDRVRRRA